MDHRKRDLILIAVILLIAGGGFLITNSIRASGTAVYQGETEDKAQNDEAGGAADGADAEGGDSAADDTDGDDSAADVDDSDDSTADDTEDDFSESGGARNYVSEVLTGGKLPPARAEIAVDNRVAYIFDLNDEVDLVIESSEGTNHLIISGGAMWVSEASCPDKVCIHQGKVYLNGDLIVCLPNRMLAKVVLEDTENP